MEFSFVKMQGVGNDFVVVDGRGDGGPVWPDVAIKACDRRFGVGADGLLVLDNAGSADFAMKMFNPDGSPDVCGNGLRCMARYARERGVVQRDTMQIETLVDMRTAQINRDAGGAFEAVTVDMGQPRFEAKDIPALAELPTQYLVDFPLVLPNGETLAITALSTGSTHSVTFVPALPDDETFLRISPLVEHHPLFPERTSLMWCAAESRNRVRMRIWERGAGETWGCGTGACAAAVVAIQHGLAERDTPVTIRSKGGELHILWQTDGDIKMTGPAESVFAGVFGT